jgi:hypothetical protein
MMTFRRWGLNRGSTTLILVLSFLAGPGRVFAQALNWEGQTGVFVTPFAYVTPSSDKGFGMPAVSYHFLSAGDVLGGFHQISITEGVFRRVEFGYTRDQHQLGSTAVVSSLWSSGFNVFHGKVNVVPENMRHQQWLPALSVGFVARTQVQNVGGVLQNKSTNNADFYLAATKTITQIRGLPVILSGGYKVTNASLLGLAGNAPAYKGRAFGAAAFALRGPKSSTLIVGSEVLQQPREVEGLPGAVIPTTITYAIRIVPSGAFPLSHHGWDEESPKFNIDLGVAQVAGQIAPGVNLNARHQFALGVSYGF